MRDGVPGGLGEASRRAGLRVSSGTPLSAQPEGAPVGLGGVWRAQVGLGAVWSPSPPRPPRPPRPRMGCSEGSEARRRAPGSGPRRTCVGLGAAVCGALGGSSVLSEVAFEELKRIQQLIPSRLQLSLAQPLQPLWRRLLQRRARTRHTAGHPTVTLPHRTPRTGGVGLAMVLAHASAAHVRVAADPDSGATVRQHFRSEETRGGRGEGREEAELAMCGRTQ